MCTIKFPPNLIEHLDKIQRCLWRKKTENGESCNSLAAWDIVCRLKKGGLGIINLQMQNMGLLLKRLHNFYNKKDVPWVDLVWLRTMLTRSLTLRKFTARSGGKT